MHQSSTTTHAETDQRLLQSVFLWMFVGLSLSAIIAWVINGNTKIQQSIMDYPFAFSGFIFGTFGIVLACSFSIHRISTVAAVIVFCVYAIFNGAAWAVIFSYFQLGTMAPAFFAVGGMFAIYVLLRYIKKTDLSQKKTSF